MIYLQVKYVTWHEERFLTNELPTKLFSLAFMYIYINSSARSEVSWIMTSELYKDQDTLSSHELAHNNTSPTQVSKENIF